MEWCPSCLAKLSILTEYDNSIKEMIESKDFLEHIADLEHEQWIVWTSYMLEHLTKENKEKWYAQCETPYPELSNEEQESDRHFARIVIDELLSKIGDNSEVKE
jgi:hypothetical protein